MKLCAMEKYWNSLALDGARQIKVETLSFGFFSGHVHATWTVPWLWISNTNEFCIFIATWATTRNEKGLVVAVDLSSAWNFQWQLLRIKMNEFIQKLTLMNAMSFVRYSPIIIVVHSFNLIFNITKCIRNVKCNCLHV